MSCLMTLLMTGIAFAAPVKNKASSLKELGSGAYQGTVKAIVCDGCGEFIQKTLSGYEGIESVVVDQKAKLVTFRVKDGAKVKVEELQKALKGSADKMGMGADYTLLDLKKIAPGRAERTSPAATPISEPAHQHQH
jgi:copper chaperone CopZ